MNKIRSLLEQTRKMSIVWNNSCYKTWNMINGMHADSLQPNDSNGATKPCNIPIHPVKIASKKNIHALNELAK